MASSALCMAVEGWEGGATKTTPMGMLLVMLTGWINRHQQDVIEYLKEENEILRKKLGAKRILLNDNQRMRLARLAIATICLAQAEAPPKPQPEPNMHETLTTCSARR